MDGSVRVNLKARVLNQEPNSNPDFASSIIRKTERGIRKTERAPMTASISLDLEPISSTMENLC
jgi:hypothetical protein